MRRYRSVEVGLECNAHMNRFRTLAFAIGMTVGSLVGAPLAAQPTAQGTGTSLPAENAAASRALEFGRTEEVYARLAVERVAAEPIRDFARRMIEDHARFYAALARFGSPGPALREEDEAVLERLRTLDGAAFEQVYIRDRAQDRMRHYNLVSELAAQAADADLRSIAAGMLPVLGRHLERAQALREQFRPIEQGPVGAIPGQSEPPAGTSNAAPPRAGSPSYAPGR